MQTIRINNNNFYFISDIDREKGTYKVTACNDAGALNEQMRAYQATCIREKRACSFATCFSEDKLKAFKAEFKKTFEQKLLEQYREHATTMESVLVEQNVILFNAQNACAYYVGKIIDAQFFDALAYASNCEVTLDGHKLRFASEEDPDICFSIFWPWNEGAEIKGQLVAEVLNRCLVKKELHKDAYRRSVGRYIPYVRDFAKNPNNKKKLDSYFVGIHYFFSENHAALVAKSCAWE